ncbi:HAD family hydrolase [Bacillus solitudinis]|uniref:HAD family hydrolase n=1 Tax=Bacillus solitudinis TaxID=2014074 RepID=UPI000C24B765|nr:HAD family phosphatase [Bacillus solitudinis]
MKAFIFDMDGVIIDSEPLHFKVDLETLEFFGVTLTKDELEKYVGMTNPEMWGRIKQKFKVDQSIDEIIDFQLSKKLAILDEVTIEPINGIRDLIEEIQTLNIPIGLASSSPREFIEKVLSKFNLTHYFSCIISGEEVEKGKPDPAVYLETARLLGVEPQSCYVLEDSRNGVIAAKAAGMSCIGYQNLNSGNQDLSVADQIVKSVKEITIKSF